MRAGLLKAVDDGLEDEFPPPLIPSEAAHDFSSFTSSRLSAPSRLGIVLPVTESA